MRLKIHQKTCKGVSCGEVPLQPELAILNGGYRLACEQLAPVVSALCILIISHTDGGEVGIHYVGAVA